MSDEQSPFGFEKNIDGYLATLSKIYEREGQRLLQSILVNSAVRVDEGVVRGQNQNWDIETYGHAVHFEVPETLFAFGLNEKNKLQDKIKDDLNQILRIPDEFVTEVSLELGIKDNVNWRKDSGLLLATTRNVPDEAARKIWGDDRYFKLFLSHTSKYKAQTAELKERLGLFGVSCFVAHKDIEPLKEWQNEIELALASMDALAALLTPGFHESFWTDQEIGFAFARRVPIIPVRLGMDPMVLWEGLRRCRVTGRTFRSELRSCLSSRTACSGHTCVRFVRFRTGIAGIWSLVFYRRSNN